MLTDDFYGTFISIIKSLHFNYVKVIYTFFKILLLSDRFQHYD